MYPPIVPDIYIHFDHSITSLQHLLLEARIVVRNRLLLVVLNNRVDVHCTAMTLSSRNAIVEAQPSSPGLFAELLLDVFGVVLSEVTVKVRHDVEVYGPNLVVELLLILFLKKLHLNDLSSLFINDLLDFIDTTNSFGF